MGKQLINGVFYNPLKPIETTGGKVMHAIKGLDHGLPTFGESYFSTCESKKPKAWKKHTSMICNLFVPVGMVKFVFYDDRPGSEDYGTIVEFTLSAQNYGRLTISPGIWFGFAGIDDNESLIMNVASIMHDPSESIRLEPGTDEIPYKWSFS